MQIEFIEESHTYLVDGVIVPSVTQIMKPMSDQYYEEIPSLVLNGASFRGTRVHKAIENFEKGIEWEVEEDVLDYLKNYRIAKQIVGFVPVENEIQLTDGFFAGTIDCIAIHETTMCIIDFKATSKFNRTLAEVQLAGYVELCERNHMHINKTYILHITKTGYKFHKVQPDFGTWIDLKNAYFQK